MIIMQLKLLSNIFLLTLYLFFRLPYIETTEQVSVLFFTFLLNLLAYYCYKKFEKNYSVDLFIYLLVIMGWILTLFTIGNNIGLTMGNVLLSLFPSFVLLFFFSLFDPKYYRKYKKLMLTQAALGLLSFFTYITFSNTVDYAIMVTLSILFTLFTIIFVYYKELHEHRFQKVVKSICIGLISAIFPYLGLHLFPTFILNREAFSSLYWLIYLFILFPIVIIHQFELKLQVKSNSFDKQNVLFFSGLLAISYFFLSNIDVSSKQLLLGTYLTVSLYGLYNFFIEKKEQKYTDNMNILKDKQYEIQLGLLSNQRFESVAKLLVKIINEKFNFEDAAIIWQFHAPPYFVLKNGELENLSLNSVNDELNQEELTVKFFSNDKYLLTIPIMENHEKIGVFCFTLDSNTALSQTFLDDVSTYTHQIGQILFTANELFETQEIYRKSQFSSIERETYLKQLNLELEAKEKLANYLHDDVLQSLLAVKNMVNVLEEESELKELINRTLEELSNSLRYEMTELFPTFLYETSLQIAVENLIIKRKKSFGNKDIDFELNIAITNQLTNELKIFFYRTIKELITNVFKHSEATKCTVDLLLLEEQYKLKVVDNGIGVYVDEIETDEDFYYQHVGLLTVKQEIDYKNGEFNVFSRKNSGTRIEILLPIE
ncbi:hypothetical protein C7H83_11360 [Tetragenococcus halophilus]|uniref:Histidine kinase domain-containing protein n=1 Tax=Tetragenococcus halophilus TaxID=51669 RepID=A0A3G5FKZ2_TETHA|nr:ATP-binding protein [Tetragenococcus halophilus]AYW51026.1 hypothetical protein C7H83_11360 [Tetragenococcus halophilus]GBD64355.1 hypothetical protein TEHD23766T_1782 [Tetragenococcus halophilus subsp. flandriensis]